MPRMNIRWPMWYHLKRSRIDPTTFSRELPIQCKFQLCDFHDLTYFSREQPLENLKSAPGLLTGDEQWFDCETHSPVNLKEGQRTPLSKSTPSIRCPPAPNRYGSKYEISDDELEPDDDIDNLNESGIRPLDSSAVELMREKTEKSPSSKRIRRDEILVEEPSEPAESRFSELLYLEAKGTVITKRQVSGSEPEKRECKMLISYRVCKDDPLTIQVALIVYKSNSNNLKSRRNLMSQFELKSDELSSPLSTPSTSRCRSTVKNRMKSDDEKTMEASTAPMGYKFSKAIKRPISKASLRF